MGQALYRKYRSKSFDEVVGQSHITTTLKNAIQAGKISHAYLFTGPRGVGKTSIARILAHEVNGLPYDSTNAHLDIIEIDAASNRRIDEIRDLRERVHVAPTSATYKVYIIDEVHMLTREAFNALLKTLEEPPAHAIFILATTEAHKLPETIVSRTQRFTFKPIPPKAMVSHLKALAKKEKITITDAALTLIAEHGGGSFRDSISLLDQMSGTEERIDSEHVEHILGIPHHDAIKTLGDTVVAGDSSKAIAQVDELLAKSSAELIAKHLTQDLKHRLLQSTAAATHLTTLMKALIDVPRSHDPTTALHIALIEATLTDPQPALTTPKPVVKISPVSTQPTINNKPTAKPVAPPAVSPLSDPHDSPDDVWQQVLEEIKKHHATLYGVVRMAKPQITNREITLSFKFPFHQKRINEARNKKVITDIVHQLTGDEYTVTCRTITNAEPKIVKKTPTKTTDSKALSTISNIFGDAEVLES